MLIDWFTVVAQLLNFIILLWLMKRFLYKPILAAIDAREKLILAKLTDADAKKAEAQKQESEFQRKNEEFDQQRLELLNKAKDEAKTVSQRLVAEAKKAADTMAANREEGFKNDIKNRNHSLSRRTQREVFAIAKKVLTDLADVSLEDRMCELLIRQLLGMDKQAFKSMKGPAIVRSAFELSSELRDKIQKALLEIFEVEMPIQFETTPDLVAGIEISTNGQRVAWSVAKYLVSLEQGVREILGSGGESEKSGKVPAEKNQPKIAENAHAN